MWRSTQLTEALSVPPTNHLTCGGVHSSTRLHGVDHSRSPAIFAQNASGSLSASAYSSVDETCALRRNSAGGSNFRFSWRRTSISDILVERGAGSGERGAGSGERGAGSGKREAGSGKREAGSGKREAGSGKRGLGLGQAKL